MTIGEKPNKNLDDNQNKDKTSTDDQSSIFSKYGVLGSIALISAFVGQVMTSDVKYNNKNNLSDGYESKNVLLDSSANSLFANFLIIPPNLAGNDLADFLVGKIMDCRQIFRLKGYFEQNSSIRATLTNDDRKRFEQQYNSCGGDGIYKAHDEIAGLKYLFESGSANHYELVLQLLSNNQLADTLLEISTSMEIVDLMSDNMDFYLFENLHTIHINDEDLIVDEKILKTISRLKDEVGIDVTIKDGHSFNVETLPSDYEYYKLKDVINSILSVNPSQWKSVTINNASFDEHTMPEAIFSLTNLKALTLKGNQIKNLPAAITNLSNLEEIYLTENLIEKIPERFSKLTKLKKIDLSSNRLKSNSFADDFWQMENLISLELDYNLIDELPKSISGFKNIENLELSHNQIALLPSDLANLQKLNKLTIDGNYFTSIPEEIGNISSLEFLSISLWNHTVPESFINLKKLNALQLYNSLVSIVPTTVEQMKWLKILDITQDADYLIIGGKECQRIKKKAEESMPETKIYWSF